MALIFVNYRRGPHSISVSALAERLAHHFGQDLVFHDTQLRPGGCYPDELQETLDACTVLVAVLHTTWVQDLDDRRSNPPDWVVREISTVLAAGKTVIPVLLDSAELPLQGQLPPSIADLALRQAVRLRASHFASDMNDLIRQLEGHVAPNRGMTAFGDERSAEPRSKRFGFKAAVLGWSGVISITLLPRILESDDPLWRTFVIAGLFSMFVMILSVPLLLLYQLTRRTVYRQERKLGVLSARTYAARIWGVAAFAVAFIIIVWIKLVNRGGNILNLSNDLQMFVGLAGVITLMVWVQRLYQNMIARDEEWPPVVTSKPAVFRRAARRLHERLTTAPDWRHPRPRLYQEQAVLVYLGLAEARLDLKARCAYSCRQWLTHGRSETMLSAFYLGWTLATTGLLLTACASSLRVHDMSIRVSVAACASLILIAIIAAFVIVTEFRTYRHYCTWLTEELTLLLAQVGPLVFASQTYPDRGGGTGARGGADVTFR
jgi:TIR domain